MSLNSFRAGVAASIIVAILALAAVTAYDSVRERGWQKQRDVITFANKVGRLTVNWRCQTDTLISQLSLDSLEAIYDSLQIGLPGYIPLAERDTVEAVDE